MPWFDFSLVTIILLFGCGGSWLLYRSLDTTVDLQRRERLTAAGQAVIDAFDLDLKRALETVRSTSLMIASQDQLRRTEFLDYTNRVSSGSQVFSFLEWQPVVPAPQLAAFEARVRADGLPDFRVTEPAEGRFIPVRPRAEYVPVLFAWPEASGAIGVDMGFDPARMTSKLMARDTGRAIASESFRLISDGKQSEAAEAFAISMAVYRDANPNTVEARRASLQGYVAGVILIANLLRETALRADSGGFDLLVFDQANASRKLLLSALGEDSDWHTSPALINTVAGEQDLSLTIEVGSRPWELVLHPRPEFLARNSHRNSQSVLSGGLIATLLLAAALFWLLRSRRLIEASQAASLHAEHALAEERQHLANVVDGTNAGTWEWNVQTGEVKLNERWAQMIGYTLAELSPISIQTWEALIHPDDFVRTGELLVQHFNNTLPYFASEFRMRHKNGKWVWIASHGRLFSHTAEGLPEWIAGTQVEITEQKRLTQSLIDLKGALDAHAIVAITDKAGRITYANNKFCEVSGYSLDELLGKDHRIINSGHHPKYFFAELWQTIGSGHAWRGQICNQAKSGRLYWVDTTIAPILDMDGKPEQYIAIRYEITDAKLHEERLLEAKEAAERANRAKSEFLANMSHEIRTPMNAIMGLTQLVLNTPLQPQQQDYLEKVFGSSRSLLGILNDILDYSKIEAGQLELSLTPLSPHALFADVTDLFGSEIERKGLKLLVHIAPDVPQAVVGDPLRLGQILNNLIGNAIKFTEHGEIQLQLELMTKTGTGSSLRFSVKDSGIGLSPEQSARIFQAFAQADNSITRRFGGTGLGLSICQRLVSLMGGEITVSSEPGKGANFSFTVALQEAPHHTSDSAHTHSSSTGLNDACQSFAGARVLLVEDNRINQLVAIGMLKQHGVEPVVVEHGGLAVEAVAQECFDLILMDQHMPTMDGCEASTIIHALPGLANLPIIAMTAAVMQADKERCIAAGMVDFVAKPIEPEELARVLLKWLPAALAQSAVPHVQAPANENTSAAILAWVKALRPYLEEYELIPETLIAQLHVLRQTPTHSEALQQLAQQLDRFDHEGALASLSRIQAKLCKEPSS
ncbi:hypothetical protein GCM10027046_23670 [Uliginosibacterium flavum]